MKVGEILLSRKNEDICFCSRTFSILLLKLITTTIFAPVTVTFATLAIEEKYPSIIVILGGKFQEVDIFSKC